MALIAQPAQAQERDAPRLKTESPYFFVQNGDPALDLLPLKSTQVDVRISGVIADVTVTQRYKNEGQRAIEAKYVFPGSTRSDPNTPRTRTPAGAPMMDCRCTAFAPCSRLTLRQRQSSV